jgi:hypothetical protein
MATRHEAETKALLDGKGRPVLAEVYWDEADPYIAGVGYSYRLVWEDGSGREESGGCDDALDPWQDVYAFLGPEACYSDGTDLPRREIP